MSVLCVASTIRRPCSSEMPRTWTSALSAPRSDVSPPVLSQWLMAGICGTLGSSKNVRYIRWLGVRSAKP